MRRITVKRWKRQSDATTAAVGRPGDLAVGSLFDDPGLQRALGLDPSGSTSQPTRPVAPDGRTASMLRAAQYAAA